MKNIRQSCSARYGEMNSIRYLQHLQHPFIQEMILIITVLSKLEQWLIIKNLLLPLRKNHFIRQEQQQNTEISYLHCLLVSIPRKMGVWYWLQRKITERNKTENYHRSGDDDHAGA